MNLTFIFRGLTVTVTLIPSRRRQHDLIPICIVSFMIQNTDILSSFASVNVSHVNVFLKKLVFGFGLDFRKNPNFLGLNKSKCVF